MKLQTMSKLDEIKARDIWADDDSNQTLLIQDRRYLLGLVEEQSATIAALAKAPQEIQAWGRLSPPRADFLSDLSWWRGILDAALKGACRSQAEEMTRSGYAPSGEVKS